ncbi:MAG: aldo/keto reductase [Acidobacteriaceae bacterium]
MELNKIPSRTLYTGATIPMIGLGTYGSDSVSAPQVAQAVLQAAEMGYRHFDCAAVYGNEAEIGAALGAVIRSGIPREQLWITSKLWNDSHSPVAVEAACADSMQKLGVDYLDAYLVHWPFPNHHPPGCDIESRSPNARPYIHDEFMRTWRKMEELVDRGWVRHIGTSNITIPKLQLLLRDAWVQPALNQMEMHPHFQQQELFEFLNRNAIVPVGFCPLGSPNRPERDRTTEDTSPLSDPVILKIAKRCGVHPASVCLKWAVQRGHVVIPFSIRPAHQMANLEAVTGLQLSDQDMADIRSIDRNCRLIKGQVFLWRPGQSWRDLWDEDGNIAQ